MVSTKKTQIAIAITLVLLAGVAPVQATAGYKEPFDMYMQCGDGSTASFEVADQSSCASAMLSAGHLYYSYKCDEGNNAVCHCITSATCDEQVTFTPNEEDILENLWYIKLQVCSSKKGLGVSTCDDDLLSADQKAGCLLGEAAGRSGSYPCACGTETCTEPGGLSQVCTSATSTCADQCSASTVVAALPANSDAGDCSVALLSGGTCQPECHSGYALSCLSSCTDGSMTHGTCDKPILTVLDQERDEDTYTVVFDPPTAACAASRLYEVEPVAGRLESASSVPLAGVAMVSVAAVAAFMAVRIKRGIAPVDADDVEAHEDEQEEAEVGAEARALLLSGAL